MKIVLYLVLTLTTSRVAYADTQSSNSGFITGAQAMAELAKREASLPIYDLSMICLENQDGTISLGNFTESEPHKLYIWRGIRVNPKSIPNLNVQEQGSSYNPGSLSYEIWTRWRYKFVDAPPRQYLWDKQLDGFIAVWFGAIPGHPFFRAGNEVYKKPDLPADAKILNEGSPTCPTIIPTFQHPL
jgi:hypothetical protein